MFSQNSIIKSSLPLIIHTAKAHRKPRWIPVAKSKIYRIPQRPSVTEEERLELLRINNNYKTQMRAIRRFYYDDMIREQSSLESASSELSQRVEAEEWDRCVKINDQWNKQVAAEREERRKLEIAEKETYALARMEAKDKDILEKIAKASEEIRREKELSITFITPENLDEAIENALANPVDYNFAIDLSGKIYSGRETPIVKTEENQTQSV